MDKTLTPRRCDVRDMKKTPPCAATPLPDVSDSVIDGYLQSVGGRCRDGAAFLARRTAIHEAGHVVAGVVLHGPNQIEFATIEPPPAREVNGFVRFRTIPSLSPRWNRALRLSLAAATEVESQCAAPLWVKAMLRAVGIRAYAGVVAQYCAPFADPDEVLAAEIAYFDPGSRRCRPHNLSDDVAESSAADREMLAWFSKMLKQRIEADGWIPAHWRDARRLLSRRWDRVHAVAAALLTEGTVDGEVLDRIVLGSRDTL